MRARGEGAYARLQCRQQRCGVMMTTMMMCDDDDGDDGARAMGEGDDTIDDV